MSAVTAWARLSFCNSLASNLPCPKMYLFSWFRDWVWDISNGFSGILQPFKITRESFKQLYLESMLCSHIHKSVQNPLHQQSGPQSQPYYLVGLLRVKTPPSKTFLLHLQLSSCNLLGSGRLAGCSPYTGSHCYLSAYTLSSPTWPQRPESAQLSTTALVLLNMASLA